MSMYNRIPANPEARELYLKALEARTQLQMGFITYDQAKAVVQEYIDYANERGKEISKKYNRRHKKLSLHGFLR